MDIEPRITNGTIRRTFLGFEDHGIFTANLQIDGAGWGQGFGNRALSGAYTDSFIQGVIKALGVDSWEQLLGLHCRVRYNEGGYGPIDAIGHIIEDRWFDPSLWA